MASSEQVRKLVESHSRGDDRSFRQAVSEAAAEARNAKSNQLADDLEALAAPRSTKKRPLTSGGLRPLPASDDDAPLLTVTSPTVGLDDLVLAPKLRSLIDDVVAENERRTLLGSFGLQPRRKLLFAGPSGTGKSKTAEGVAASLGLPVAKVRLASVVSSYLGETSRHLDRIFSFAAKNRLVLIFDEVDMLGAEREGSDHGELRRVVAAFLQALEEHATEQLVIATTNHGKLLDDALWRRFDEVALFDLPNRTQAEELVRLKLTRMKSKVNKEVAARAVSGLSQADIEAVCLGAMRTAVMSGRTTVSTDDVVGYSHSRRSRLKEAGRSLG